MSDIDEIKKRLSVVDVIGVYIELKPAGSSFKAKCPFHNEKTPSFTVSPERGAYYCFGCGAGGDIFNFVQEFEGVDFTGALKMLADRAGVTLTGRQKNPEAKQLEEELYTINEVATLFYESKLGGSAAADYLGERGVAANTIKTFRIGFAPPGWRNLLDHLKAQGFKEDKIIAAGLAKKTTRKDGSTAVYDRFRNRVMFPLTDSSGRTIAFSGRSLEAGDKVAKYLNSPETDIFSKRDSLFGIYQAKQAVRKNDFVILAEGQFDVVMSHQAGFPNTVASSGTAFDVNGQNFSLLRRLTNNFILAFDDDRAGHQALLKAGQAIMSLGGVVKVPDIPAGQDPADVIAEDKEKWKQIIKDSEHITDFLAKYIIKSESDRFKQMQLVKIDILPIIKVCPDPLTQSHFLKIIAKILDVKESDLRSSMESVQAEVAVSNLKQNKPLLETTDKDGTGEDKLVSDILEIYFWKENKEQGERIKKTLIAVAGKEMWKEYIDIEAKDKNVKSLIAEQRYEESLLEQVIDDLLARFEVRLVEKQIDKLQVALEQAEIKGDTAEADEILKQILQARQRLEKIS